MMLAGGIAGDGAITEEMAKKKLYKKNGDSTRVECCYHISNKANY